eukprot:768602-Hanusia_phi.AAC.1
MSDTLQQAIADHLDITHQELFAGTLLHKVHELSCLLKQVIESFSLGIHLPETLIILLAARSKRHQSSRTSAMLAMTLLPPPPLD